MRDPLLTELRRVGRAVGDGPSEGYSETHDLPAVAGRAVAGRDFRTAAARARAVAGRDFGTAGVG
ncbi:hypothetical protein SAMN05421874_113151 [Nonomuraea maritima]|uniref:Uncharacterized protein n=1 Tax=Nonomuraea maritima TaxID=683260 RepID=A0A1G9G5C2_9ACTN|nr:hypothetical protein [Nonomuraea maritima]SDK95802.1 hypothetical protein SAMN05421874_113151 [Nonomuraea maritima]